MEEDTGRARRSNRTLYTLGTRIIIVFRCIIATVDIYEIRVSTGFYLKRRRSKIKRFSEMRAR